MPSDQSNQPDARCSDGAVSPWPGWTVLFLLFFVLYALTASRGPQWQDSGYHMLRVVTGQLMHPLGLALCHPLHHWLGRFVVAVDVLEPCFAITLISSVAAAVAVANIYGCVLTLTRCRLASLFGAASLGFAHTFWWMATLAEVNTLTVALLTAECWCVVSFYSRHKRSFLIAACLFNGLGLANHMLASLTTVILLVVVVSGLRARRIRGRDVILALSLWVIASLPYTGLVLSQWLDTGDLAGTIRSALFGTHYVDEVLNVSFSSRMVVIAVGFVLLSFPSLFLPMSVYGWSRAARVGIPGSVLGVLSAAFVLHAGFALRYNVLDQHTFFLSTYAILAIFSGVGMAALLRSGRSSMRQYAVIAALILLMLTPGVYAVVPSVAKRFDVLRSVARDKPYRDDYVYLFSPWSVVDRSAEKMSRHAVELAGERGLILVEDAMAAAAVRYRVWRNGLSGVEVALASRVEEFETMCESGVVVLVPRTVGKTETPSPFGTWARRGDLYVLEFDPA